MENKKFSADKLYDQLLKDFQKMKQKEIKILNIGSRIDSEDKAIKGMKISEGDYFMIECFKD